MQSVTALSFLSSDRAPPRSAPPREAILREAATAFEAMFLAEMFKHSGLGDARFSFGGGVGEEAFSGMLADEWGKATAAQGGVGLAERVYQAMLSREAGDV